MHDLMYIYTNVHNYITACITACTYTQMYMYIKIMSACMYMNICLHVHEYITTCTCI